MQETVKAHNERTNKQKKKVSYNNGDQVMLWSDRVSTKTLNETVIANHMAIHKLIPKWIGPCTITGKISDELYWVHNSRDFAFEVHCHVQFLKPYNSAVDYTTESPPLINLVDAPDLQIYPATIQSHDIFDINFDRRLRLEEDITPAEKKFEPLTNPQQDSRIGQYFKYEDQVYKTFYINYHNGLKAPAIWFSPIVDHNGFKIPGGPTRFCSLQEYDKHFKGKSHNFCPKTSSAKPKDKK